MEKVQNINKTNKVYDWIFPKKKKINFNITKKHRIEQLKVMINNEEYINEAIQKLANSLTSRLMK